MGRPSGTTICANVFAKASEFTIWVNSHTTKLIKIAFHFMTLKK